MWDLLSDPQTSGGLLFAVPEDEAERMLQAFEQADLGTKVSVVGRCLRVVWISRAYGCVIRRKCDESETIGSFCTGSGDKEFFDSCKDAFPYTAHGQCPYLIA